MKNKFLPILLSVFTMDEYMEDGGGAALLELTPELKKTILTANSTLLKVKKTIKSAFDLAIFDFSIDMYTRGNVDDIDENLLNDFDNNIITHKQISKAKLAKFKKIEETIRIEAVTFQVDGDKVHWRGYYKDTNIMFETGSIYIKDLRKMKF